MLLLLLGFCLRRRWLRSKARGEIEKDVNDSEMGQGPADSGEAGAEPLPELVTEQDRIEGLRILQPARLPRGGISNRMFWRFGARKTVAAATKATDGFGRQWWAFTAPVAASEAATEAIITVPDTGCVACASSSGGNGQVNLSADAQRRASRKASIDVEPPPSTHLKPSPARKVMSQGKLAEAVEAAPTDKAARFRARKASITAGDELFEGAKGTKEGPGREASTRRGRTSLATSEAAHMAAKIRSALNYDAGSSGSISIPNSGRQTEPSARDQRVPNPPARRPDDIWAGVRARRAATAALNTDRRQRLQAMRRELARPSFRERSSVGQADPVRV